jgi:hypothetical protein
MHPPIQEHVHAWQDQPDRMKDDCQRDCDQRQSLIFEKGQGNEEQRGKPGDHAQAAAIWMP